MKEFRLPDVGEGLTEAEIVAWRVAAGDVVAVNDVLVDIETAKSIVELPSPFAGRIDALLIEPGTTVPVGTPIVRIDAGDDEPTPAGDGEGAEGSGEKRQAVLVGYGPSEGRAARRRTPRSRGANGAAPAPVAVLEPEPVAEPAPVAETSARALARPPVRRLAKVLGVDIARIPHTGVVTRADVEAFAAGAVTEAPAVPAAPAQPSAPAAGAERIPVTGVRKVTAEAMVSSAFTAPHVTEWVTVDVSRTMELLARLKADRAWAGVSLTPTVLIARAVCLALRRTPELNSAWDHDAIVRHGHVDLGIAAATERGLVVPNVRGAQDLDVRGLAEAIADLVATARTGRIQPSHLSGGTFTITNIGVFGIDAGTPILNPGQSGILAVGQIARRPWVDADDQIVPRWVTTLALSFDHRVVDGEQGSRFLADVAALLRDPDLALTW